jgi:gliding motility-associated-like protein
MKSIGYHKNFVFIFFLFLGNIAIGQNLIADPSFEEGDLNNTSTLDLLSQLDNWWTVHGTPDYHHEANTGSNLTQLNNCPLGNGDLDCGVPVEGSGVLGIYKPNDTGGGGEWAATQLVEPMVDGECYLISFYIQNKKDNPSFIAETSNWGVLFSSTGLPAFDPASVDYSNLATQYVSMDEMLDSNDWRYVEWTYTADYAYQFMYLGYMGYQSTATYNIWSTSGSIGYYAWVDVVTVMPIDSVEIEAMPDFELCEDSTAFLSASCNVNYKWEWEENGNTYTSTDSILQVNPSVTTTYYAYAGDMDACFKVDSVTVTAIDCSCLIPIETTYTVVDNTNCPLSETGNGSIAVDPSNGIAPYTFQWNDPLMQTSDSATALAGGTYQCIITDADNCTDTISAFVDEGNIPNMIFDVTDETCPNSGDGSINLSVQNGNAPYTYLWSNDSTTQDISELTSGYYAVTVTDNINCPFTDSAFVSFAPLAQYSFPVICEGSGVTDLNFMGVSNGTWSGTGITDPSLGLFDPSLAGVGVFTINFVSDIDCTDDFAMEVIVDALPNVNFTANVQNGCQPLDVLFSVADDGSGSTYIWNFGDGNVSSNPVNTQFTYVNYGIFDVSLSITDSNGCSNSLAYPEYINVYERPVADFNFTPEELDDVQSQVQFTSTSSDVTSNWFWTFGDGGTSYTENPVHEYSQPGYFQVSLTASSDIGCTDIATDYIKYKEVIYMYVPNAFTPNNDGRNDVFLVEARGEIDLFSLKIFDRWGGLVFETTDINEPWVGNKMGGDYYLNTEVFNYILEYEAWGPQLEEPVGETIRGTIMLMK